MMSTFDSAIFFIAARTGGEVREGRSAQGSLKRSSMRELGRQADGPSWPRT